MKKSTWYYPNDQVDSVPADAEAMRRCGLTTVLCNTLKDDVLNAMADALEGSSIELHAEMSLAQLYKAVTGHSASLTVLKNPGEFNKHFLEHASRGTHCWSGDVDDVSDLAEYLVELIRRHPSVKGICLDGIRYANMAIQEDFPCDCENCHARREPWLGHGTLTEQDRRDPSIMYKEIQTKNKVISGVVSQLAQAVHEAGAELSIAARTVYAGRDEEFKDGPARGYGASVFEGQDWQAWCDNGWLDVIHFMNYSTDMVRFERLARTHQALVGDTQTAIHEGIGVSSSAGELSPEMFKRQIDIVKDLGMPGITIFSWGQTSEDHMTVLRDA